MSGLFVWELSFMSFEEDRWMPASIDRRILKESMEVIVAPTATDALAMLDVNIPKGRRGTPYRIVCVRPVLGDPAELAREVYRIRETR